MVPCKNFNDAPTQCYIHRATWEIDYKTCNVVRAVNRAAKHHKPDYDGGRLFCTCGWDDGFDNHANWWDHVLEQEQ